MGLNWGDIADYTPIVSNIKNKSWNPLEAGKQISDDAQKYLGYGPIAGPGGVKDGSMEDPNAAFQAQQNFGTSRDFLGRLQQSDAEHQRALAGQGQVVAGQNRLLGQLDNTINNPNASSVAQTQLTMQNDANANRQMGAAAGVQGPNAFAARRAALQNIAQGNTGTQQAGALARAAETAHAQNAKASVLNQQGGVFGQMGVGADRRYGQDTNAASEFAGNAARGQHEYEAMKYKVDNDNQDKEKTWNGKIISGITSKIPGLKGIF